MARDSLATAPATRKFKFVSALNEQVRFASLKIVGTLPKEFTAACRPGGHAFAMDGTRFRTLPKSRECSLQGFPLENVTACKGILALAGEVFCSPLGIIGGKYMRTWAAMKMSLPPWTLWKLNMLTSREQPALI